MTGVTRVEGAAGEEDVGVFSHDCGGFCQQGEEVWGFGVEAVGMDEAGGIERAQVRVNKGGGCGSGSRHHRALELQSLVLEEVLATAALYIFRCEVQGYRVWRGRDSRGMCSSVCLRPGCRGVRFAEWVLVIIGSEGWCKAAGRRGILVLLRDIGWVKVERRGV